MMQWRSIQMRAQLEEIDEMPDLGSIEIIGVL